MENTTLALNKPRNHVTEALTKGHTRPVPMPDVPEDLLLFLEGLYPPRCYDPRAENLEAHLRYAGHVDLIAALRASFEEQTRELVLDDAEDAD